jgi:hypothetical protein
MSNREPISGECTACGEWTTVPGSCCGAAVKAEGHLYFDEDVDDGTEEASSLQESKTPLREG